MASTPTPLSTFTPLGKKDANKDTPTTTKSKLQKNREEIEKSILADIECEMIKSSPF